jgi:hypothetical protein
MTRILVSKWHYVTTYFIVYIIFFYYRARKEWMVDKAVMEIRVRRERRDMSVYEACPETPRREFPEHQESMDQ